MVKPVFPLSGWMAMTGVLAVGSEFCQSAFPGKSFDRLDIVANLGGVILGGGLVALRRLLAAAASCRMRNGPRCCPQEQDQEDIPGKPEELI